MTNERQFIRVKEWIIDKAQETASGYNCFIDYAERDEVLGCAKVVDGYIKVQVEEVLKETEKAVYVRLHTGDVVGSIKGWKVWIPKSQMLTCE